MLNQRKLKQWENKIITIERTIILDSAQKKGYAALKSGVIAFKYSYNRISKEV